MVTWPVSPQEKTKIASPPTRVEPVLLPPKPMTVPLCYATFLIIYRLEVILVLPCHTCEVVWSPDRSPPCPPLISRWEGALPSLTVSSVTLLCSALYLRALSPTLAPLALAPRMRHCVPAWSIARNTPGDRHVCQCAHWATREVGKILWRSLGSNSRARGRSW